MIFGMTARVLHFLLTKIDRKYITNIESCISSGGFAVIETFSTEMVQDVLWSRFIHL